MKIDVKKTENGSPDGIEVNLYEAGKTYEMTASLAAIFLKEKWGVKHEEPKPVEPKPSESEKPQEPAKPEAPKPGDGKPAAHTEEKK